MSDDIKIWQRRWDSINSTIQQVQTDLDGKTIDRQSTLKDLVQALKSFGEAQFNFFNKGFGFADPNNQTLERSMQYPPEFVLKRILDQMANDIWVIENAIKQREDINKVAALKQADLLAYRAIQPVLGVSGAARLLPENSTVITYFQKVPEVRIIPYANVALIGIPYSANPSGQFDKDSSLRDLLAIPHEIGHFVFWRGMVNGERLHILLRQKLLQAGLSHYDHWLEEIFADVYGCLIGGSAFALSSQDIQLDNMPIRLTTDDGRHPAAVLRPYLSIAVLESEAGNATADPLKKHWQTRIRQKGDPQNFQLNDQQISVFAAALKEPNDVNENDNDVKTIVKFILKTLKDAPNMANVFQLDWSDRQASTPDDLTSLYQSFATKLNPGSGSPLDASNPNNVVRPDFSVPDKTTSWVHKLRDDVPLQSDNKMPAEVWSVVMNANGWGGGGQEETYPN